MARVVTTDNMTKIALYMTLPASAPANSATASLVRPPVAITPASSSGTATNSAVSAAATAYLLAITTERGTGVASRCTMLPSSTSAPSTLVPLILLLVTVALPGGVRRVRQLDRHGHQQQDQRRDREQQGTLAAHRRPQRDPHDHPALDTEHDVASLTGS